MIKRPRLESQSDPGRRARERLHRNWLQSERPGFLTFVAPHHHVTIPSDFRLISPTRLLPFPQKLCLPAAQEPTGPLKTTARSPGGGGVSKIGRMKFSCSL